MEAAGYSGTPLWKKLGVKEGMKGRVIHPPSAFDALLGQAWQVVEPAEAGEDIVLFFTNSLEELEEELPRLQRSINRSGMVWVCWYKKAAKKPTDLTEDLIRKVALALDFVDVKVCAVDQEWSGLKLVIRTERR